MQRFEYEVPGNMINEGKNYPLEFSFPGLDGKQEKVWINYLDMVAMYQAEVEYILFHDETLEVVKIHPMSKHEYQNYYYNPN